MVIDINIPRLERIKDELQNTIWGTDAGVYVAQLTGPNPYQFQTCFISQESFIKYFINSNFTKY